MTLAWGAHLTPSPKLLLMALADISNDDGVCWPSVRLLAKKCCLSEREIRRILEQLKSAGYIRINKRFRTDGSQTSNSYIVLPSPSVGGGDKLTGGSDKPNRGGGHRAQPADATGDRPINDHIDPSETPPQPNRGGGGVECLIYPEAFGPSERIEAAKRLHGLPTELAQEILFELAGRIRLTAVKNPLRYLTALTQSAKAGTFKPDLAQRVRESHERGIASAEALARVEVQHKEAALPINLDRLPPRLREIVQKHVKPAADPAARTHVMSE